MKRFQNTTIAFVLAISLTQASATPINGYVADAKTGEVKKEHDLEKEWEEFFDKMDGKADSYKKLSFPNEGVGTDKDGEVYKMHISVNYDSMKTDKGTVYKNFGYYRERVLRDDPEAEGLSTFTMQDPGTGDWITVGDR